jgi:hypothetical protein
MSAAPSSARSGSFASTQACRAVATSRPSTGSMCSFTMASGFDSATASISTPPSADSINRCFLAARSSVNDA